MKEQKLTAKQERFVEEFPVDWNGTQAAIRAGYSEKTAAQMGAENLTKPVIQTALQKKKQEISERNNVTIDYIVEKLNKNLARAMEEEEVTDSEGNSVGVFKYDGSVANKAIELLGKTIGAFQDNIKHEGDLNIAVKNYTRN